MHYPKNTRARHWEEAGIVVGLLLVIANWVALVSPVLSGPVFHPAWMVFGVVLAFWCALGLGGVSRDYTEQDY